MRTQKEILSRIKAIQDNNSDLFGTELNDLICALEFENAKPFLKKGTKDKDWQQTADVKKEMIEYMSFAWEKANDKRGLSAMRSLAHYKAWLFLDGDDEIWPTLDKYEHYGKEHLITICGYLGLDPNLWDDGVRENE